MMGRIAGSSTPTATVNFGTRCGTTSSTTLHVAQWDAATSKWKDKGNGANTSTTLAHAGTLPYSTTMTPILVGRLTRLKADAGSDAAYCTGASTALSASATNGTSGFSYAWTPTTGLSSSTVSNPTVTATSTTNYVLTITDSRSCTAKDTVGITVHSLPTADAGADNNSWIGFSIPIGSSPASGLTYSWSPTTALSSSTIANPNAGPVGNQTYTLTVTNTNGCVDTDEVTVTVLFPPSLPDCTR